MQIATFLGLQDGGRTLVEAEGAWPGWVAAEDALPALGCLLELPGWLRGAERDRVDEVLWTLARMASPTGGDNPLAASALAWLLLPGAGRLAGELGPDLAGDVAMQLWLGCRNYPWQRRHSAVAANVLRDLRRTMLRGNDLTGHSVLLDPTDRWWQQVQPPAAPATSSWQHLLDVLTLARDSGRVDETDIGMVVLLAEAAHGRPVGSRHGWAGGLLAGELTERIGAQMGRSGRTVRRRARRTLDVMAEVAQESDSLVGTR